MKTPTRAERTKVIAKTNRHRAQLPSANSRATLSAVSPLKRKSILVPVDFSDCSRRALDYAISFAKQFGADVTLLHAIHANYHATSSDYTTFDYPELIEETRRAGEKQLVALARSIQKNYPVKTVIQTGHPGSVIVNTGKRLKTELIITSTHGRTGFKRAFLGSTAEHVVRHALCPVLTVPGRESRAEFKKAPAFRLKKILVPIDFSEISKNALAYAAFLSAHFEAEVILLHVVQKFPIDYLLGRALMNEMIVPLMKQAEFDLKNLAGSLGKSTGVNVSASVCDGTPFEEICRAANTLGVDLIVLTTHGYTGLKHVALGSTAERVVRHANCPVLVVRGNVGRGAQQKARKRRS